MRRFTILAVTALGSLAATAGTAAAGNDAAANRAFGPAPAAKALKATAPIQENNGACGENIGAPEIGFVKFVRKGNTLKLNVVLKHGAANTTYGVDMGGNGCSELGRAGEFTTNKKGIGHGKASLEVPEGDSEFFADIDTGGFHSGGNDTTIVTLP